MNKILIAYDGSDAAYEALHMGSRLARANNAEVRVISVVPLVSTDDGPTVDPRDDVYTHDQQLAEARLLLGFRDIEPELFNKTGDPAHLIEVVAERDGYDTIVMGRPAERLDRDRSRRDGVVRHVAEHARARVLVAP